MRWNFTCWRLVGQIAFAKSGSWRTTTTTGERQHHIISIHILQERDQPGKKENYGVSVIIGPLSIVLGVVL